MMLRRNPKRRTTLLRLLPLVPHQLPHLPLRDQMVIRRLPTVVGVVTTAIVLEVQGEVEKKQVIVTSRESVSTTVEAVLDGALKWPKMVAERRAGARIKMKSMPNAVNLRMRMQKIS